VYEFYEKILKQRDYNVKIVKEYNELLTKYKANSISKQVFDLIDQFKILSEYLKFRSFYSSFNKSEKYKDILKNVNTYKHIIKYIEDNAKA
jgi:hypothetical protein